MSHSCDVWEHPVDGETRRKRIPLVKFHGWMTRTSLRSGGRPCACEDQRR